MPGAHIQAVNSTDRSKDKDVHVLPVVLTVYLHNFPEVTIAICTLASFQDAWEPVNDATCRLASFPGHVGAWERRYL